MRDRRLTTSMMLVSFLMLIIWMPSTSARADEPSTDVMAPAQKDTIQQERIQEDVIKEATEKGIQRQDGAPAGELGKDSERQMSTPPSIGPSSFDMEMTREQEAAASLAF